MAFPIDWPNTVLVKTISSGLARCIEQRVLRLDRRALKLFGHRITPARCIRRSPSRHREGVRRRRSAALCTSRDFGRPFSVHLKVIIQTNSDAERPTAWLPFLNTYRTMCLVPEPAFRRILEDIRDLQMAAQGASPTLVDAAALTRLARASSSSASRPMISAILLTLSSAGGSKSPAQFWTGRSGSPRSSLPSRDLTCEHACEHVNMLTR